MTDSEFYCYWTADRIEELLWTGNGSGDLSLDLSTLGFKKTDWPHDRVFELFVYLERRNYLEDFYDWEGDNVSWVAEQTD